MNSSRADESDRYADVPTEVMQQILDTCEEFAKQLGAGGHPRIKEYFDKIDPRYRGVLLHDLLDEELVRLGGTAIDFDAYKQQFPGFEGVIEALRREFVGLETEGSASSIPEGDTPPTTIGRFQVLRRVGGGGYGVVYLARDPTRPKTKTLPSK